MKLIKKSVIVLSFVFIAFNANAQWGIGGGLSYGFDIEEIAAQVGLTPNMEKYPHQLSGGEQQRVSIARAVVKNPKIMFCDEPTGALDEENAKEVLGVIQKLNEVYQTTVVLITHNPSIGAMADRIIKLNSGEIVEIITNNEKRKASEISWG